MSREVHVRFCESRGVRLPLATHRVIHCASKYQARQVLAALHERMAGVGLELHPDKTRIVSCKDSNRRGSSEHTSFTFPGFTFRPRRARRDDGVTCDRLARAISAYRTPVFYLEIPPSLFGRVVEGLARAGLTTRARIVVEKPLGHDLASARTLNTELHRLLDERQILRIDHFLGKEPSLDILFLRFGNSILEPLWNRDRVQSLLGDALRGDPGLFTREDSVEETWRIVQPLLDAPPRVEPYKPGSWGPASADKLLAGHPSWRDPWLHPRHVRTPAAAWHADQGLTGVAKFVRP